MASHAKLGKSIDPSAEMPVYSLQIASRLSGVPPHSIRQYKDKGLLLPYKQESGHHLFSPGDIERLKNIQILIHEKGLNFAGIRALMAMIPCWKHKDCKPENREACKGFRDAVNPCWEASEKGITCRNEVCRECHVYKILNKSTDFKSEIRELLY